MLREDSWRLCLAKQVRDIQMARMELSTSRVAKLACFLGLVAGFVFGVSLQTRGPAQVRTCHCCLVCSCISLQAKLAAAAAKYSRSKASSPVQGQLGAHLHHMHMQWLLSWSSSYGSDQGGSPGGGGARIRVLQEQSSGTLPCCAFQLL